MPKTYPVVKTPRNCLLVFEAPYARMLGSLPHFLSENWSSTHSVSLIFATCCDVSIHNTCIIAFQHQISADL